MQIIELRSLPANKPLTCSLCIVGSGPAGLTLAAEFANTSHDVIVLESGDRFREDAFTAALNEIESVGEPRVMEQRRLRNRVFGGTSHTWSGRCIPLDSIDYEARSWVPDSGWPICPQDLAPHLRRASSDLGLSHAAGDERTIQSLATPNHLQAGPGTELRPILWEFSRRPGPSAHNDYVRFGPRFAKLSAPNIRVLTHATVSMISTTEQGCHVSHLEIATPEGRLYRVRSRYVVLCAGGIENARLLLASNRLDPQGLGNSYGLVGRFLMDHPRALLGTFQSSSTEAVQQDLGLFYDALGARMQRGLSLSLDVQRSEGLLNCAAWTTQHVADDDVWRAMRSMAWGVDQDRRALGKVVLRHADQIVAGAWSRLVRRAPLPRRLKQLDLEAMIEQSPDPNSRITLSDRKDALGVPLSKIDWKIGSLERRTAMRLGRAVNHALANAGLPTATLVDWVRDRRSEDAVFSDPAHPSGTTRMAASENLGVVDANGKVFGIDNLYIAGSSVFTTSGHANPTLMIVALALRLADWLRRPEAWKSTAVASHPTIKADTALHNAESGFSAHSVPTESSPSSSSCAVASDT